MANLDHKEQDLNWDDLKRLLDTNQRAKAEYLVNYEKVGFFLDAVSDEENMMSSENAKIAEEMLKEIEEMGKYFKDLDTPTTKPILADIGGSSDFDAIQFGVSGKDYRKNFLNAVRHNFTNDATQYLKIADPAQGGYLIPEEMHSEIIVGLRENNILRKISRVMQTLSTHKIPILTDSVKAQFTGEGELIDLSNMTFDSKNISAYKLTCGISISNEIKSDSFYNLEEFIISEFGRAIGDLEEATFFNGDGQNKPLGILPQLQANTDATITTASASIAADDLINLIHKLPRPYRNNAVFIMDDMTLAAVRKFKDVNQSYIWEPQMQAGEPPRLFGYPVYTSANIPSVDDRSASGKIVVLFGDFSRYLIAQRGEMTFKPLYELHALRDLSTYLMILRVDATILDNSAIVGLKLR